MTVPSGARRIATFALVLATALLVLAGCAQVGDPTSGRPSSEARRPGAFTTIAVEDSIRLLVRIGSPASVLVSAADAGVLPHVSTDVRDGRLRIGIDGPDVPADGVRVDVVVPTLAFLTASSSADAVIVGVSATQIVIDADSSAEVRVSGTVRNLDLRGASSADIDLQQLAVATARVELGSAARAIVNASASIRGSVRDSSDLEIVGSPGQVDVQESSLGKVNRR